MPPIFHYPPIPMLAMSSIIPESAPFNEEQRAWLNGFFSGLMGFPGFDAAAAKSAVALMPQSTAVEDEPEDFPWHDASLPIVDRMALAEERPLSRRLMAAMAQLDCGSCGYVCQTYSEAIAAGEETNLTLCSPGGKDTKQMIKRLLKDASAGESESALASTRRRSTAKADDAGYSRKHPFTAKVIESRPLNKAGSAKDTRHVVIDLRGSGLHYEVGDALGIYPTNCGELAAMIVERLATDPRVEVDTPAGNRKGLIDALREDCCLKDPSDELLELLMGRMDIPTRELLGVVLANGAPGGFDVLDALEMDRQVPITANELLTTLSPLNPRLYSIASSMRRVGDQVHLTVGKVAYEREGRLRKGVASTMLAERAQPGDALRVFVQANHGGFTVPADTSTPIIMVGPGTGIAPFRAFLQERAASDSSGDSWLFYGDQHAASDFLYEDELRSYLSTSVLTRLDTAFSRDGDRKVYVQDRMREQAAELWRWLQRGAHFYVCGDAARMAADVDSALREIISEAGGIGSAGANQYVQTMQQDKRYVRDVY